MDATTLEYQLDANSTLAEKADLANRLAIEIMGWNVSEEDPRRLWRDAEGSVVTINVPSMGSLTLCEHPWKDGINNNSDMSFSPVLNYHRNIVDFRKMLLEKLANS